MSKMTPKQQMFLTAYLGAANFNATEAARLAGYGGNDQTLRAVGYENLTKPHILSAVKKAFSEKAMSIEEVIARISDFASGSLADFMDIDEHGWNINLAKAKNAGKIHLLKKVKHTKFGVEIELHSPLDALEKMAKIHKLYGDQQINVDVKILNLIMESLPYEHREQFARAIEAALPSGGAAAGA